MNLGRLPLLIEGLTAAAKARPHGTDETQILAHPWVPSSGSRSSTRTKTRVLPRRASDSGRTPLKRASTSQTQDLPKGGIRLGDSDLREPRATSAKSRSPSAQTQTREFVLHLSGSHHPPSAVHKRKPTWDAESGKKHPHEIEGEHDKVGKEFASGLHAKVAKATSGEAHEILNKIWQRRHKVNPRDTEQETHLVQLEKEKDNPRGGKFPPLMIRTPKRGGAVRPTGNPYGIPHDMPGKDHPDESVRWRAKRIEDRGHANSLAAAFTARKERIEGKRRSTPKVLVRRLRNLKTGAEHTHTSFPTKPSPPIPPGHELVHSVMSEWDARRPLLLELVNVTGNSFLSKFPAGSSINGAPGDKEPHKTATTTAKVGLVSVQRGVVPDKKKREIEIPKPEPIPPGRDGITKQFERQPANPGGVTTVVSLLKRTGLSG